MPRYAETGEQQEQVQVFSAAGEPQGEKMLLTLTQQDELAEYLPDGWYLVLS